MAIDSEDDLDPELRAEQAALRDLRMATPPTDERSLELWLQHAAGMLLFEKVRAAGLATVDTSASDEIREAVELAVNSTMYALMMQIDGVSGGLQGEDELVELTFGVQLCRGDSVVEALDLREGDGMCMGFHFWKEGDFGEDPVLTEECRTELGLG